MYSGTPLDWHGMVVGWDVVPRLGGLGLSFLDGCEGTR